MKIEDFYFFPTKGLCVKLDIAIYVYLCLYFDNVLPVTCDSKFL